MDAVRAHGRLLDPPSRSSAWRVGFNTPKDYNDMEAFCGGFEVNFVLSNRRPSAGLNIVSFLFLQRNNSEAVAGQQRQVRHLRRCLRRADQTARSAGRNLRHGHHCAHVSTGPSDPDHAAAHGRSQGILRIQTVPQQQPAPGSIAGMLRQVDRFVCFSLGHTAIDSAGRKNRPIDSQTL